MFDLIIRGGLLLDGTGAPARRADLGMAGDRIAAVGDLGAAEARDTLPADGRYVSPGFIDAHSHSDTYLLVEPSAPSKLFQGITTEVVGNCGASAAPRLGAARMPSDWQEKPYPGTWSTVAEYRRLLEQVRPAVNVALLIGHNTLRGGVVGYEGRAARPEEIRVMADRLRAALEEGGAGWSTGLVYAPGMFATPEELEALARTVARCGKIYTSHMRSEGSRLLAALDEALALGRLAGRAEISHLKTSGRANWHLVDAALARIRRARAEGLEVAADRYPYTASSTDLDVVLPDWAAEGSRERVLERLRTPALRARIREELLAGHDAAYWEDIVVGSTRHPRNRAFQGEGLGTVARKLGREPVDALLELIDTDELFTGTLFFGMSEENLWKIMREPYVMLGTDASLRAPTGPLSGDHPHPRAYGAFPRFLRAALDGRTVSLEEAVRKMTSLPADHFQLRRRGRLAEGMLADVVVFSPAVTDQATYQAPHRLASGIEAVVVNGTAVLRDGRMTGARAGRFLD